MHLIHQREIDLLLPELVVDIHARGVGVEVAHVVVAVFRRELHVPSVEERVLYLPLHEGVSVPLSLCACPHIADDGLGDTALGVVEIALHLPFPLRQEAV